MNNVYKKQCSAVNAQVEINRLVWQINLEDGHERLNPDYARQCILRCYLDLQDFYKANFGSQIELFNELAEMKNPKRVKKRSKTVPKRPPEPPSGYT